MNDNAVMAGDQQAVYGGLSGLDLLESGVDILLPVLGAAGFSLETTRAGSGSGGPFAAGRFTKADRHIELCVRYALNSVSYGWRDISLTHQDLCRGVGIRGSYPGYSDDPLDGFRHLLADLTGPLAPFLEGTDFTWYSISARVAARPQPKLP